MVYRGEMKVDLRVEVYGIIRINLGSGFEA